MADSDAESPSRVRGSIKDLILKIIGNYPTGATTDEIIEGVSTDSSIAVSTIRQALRELEQEKKIITFREPPAQKGGRPRNIYRLFDYRLLVARKDAIVRDTVDLERELEESKQLLRDLLKESSGSYPSPNKALQVYGEAARQLLNRNPIDLYCDFAEWLEERFLQEVNEWDKSKSNRDERERHRKMLERIVGLAEHVFFRTLGVPLENRDDNGKVVGQGPVAIVLDREKMQPTYLGKLVDRQALISCLRQTVFGDTVFEKIVAEKVEPPLRLGGSDSSAQPIDLSGILPWQTEARALQIVTSVGVRYDLYEKTSHTEWHPEPKVLAEYERKKAIEEGLLIPPEAEQAGEIGRGMTARVREAAMDLRQYYKDHELMFEKEPAVRIQFRDGRVFPLEHRFGDAVDYAPHGELVRSCLKKFLTILNDITGYAADGGYLFCGFVKRTYFDMISSLILWYIGFGSVMHGGKKIDLEMTLEDLFRGGTDSSVLSFIFAALNQLQPGVYVTFRIVRRFQSLQEEFIAEAPPTTDPTSWRKRLQSHTSFFSARGVPPEAIRVYANLLARANILMFYTSISAYNPQFERRISIPRVEVLLPYTDIQEYNLTSTPSTQELLTKKERNYVKDIVSVVFHEEGGILELYQEDLFPFSSNSPKVFLVPRPVNDAHIAAKEIAKVYAQDFEALLVREAKKYWQDMVASGESIP